MASLFLTGLCWCFCCGTCVGQNLLRHSGFGRYLPRSNRNERRDWKYHAPPQDDIQLNDDTAFSERTVV
ncbi:hypothetical protein K492DRAFT_207945 [Lichtheimia hyalospora FSU 10163]|nr:hypothetical protein K492DRAFT_207945 [Lichtheimia hyalospora FSU 10163]